MGRDKNEGQIFVSEHVRGTEVWERKLEFEVSCGLSVEMPAEVKTAKEVITKEEQYLKQNLRSTCLLQFSFSSV